MVNLKVKQFTAASASKEPACLSKRVSDYVLEYIGTRQLNPGDKIPSEVQLSSDLKVSRGIVREAYRSLSAAGIIEVAAGCRPKVGELSDSFLTDMIRQGICTRQFSPEQVLNLSSMMEVRAAELAAQKRTMRDLQQLRSVVARMRRAIGQTNHFFSRELAFHEAVSEASGDSLIHLIGGALRQCVSQTMAGKQRHRNRSEHVNLSIAAKSLVDAIQAGDLWQAGRLMRGYVHQSRGARLVPELPNSGALGVGAGCAER